MSDNVTDTIANGEAGAATSAPSQQQNSSNQDATVSGFSQEQLDKIGEIVSAAVQSTKDVRIQRLMNSQDKTDKTLSGVAETLARLKDYQDKYGLNEAAAIREMERDDEIAQLRRVSEPGAQASAPNLNALATSIVQGAGIDMNGQAAKDFFMSLTDTDPAVVAQKAGQFVAAQINKPQPGAVDTVSTITGATVSSQGIDALSAELATLQKQDRTPENMAKRREILAKMRQYD